MGISLRWLVVIKTITVRSNREVFDEKVNALIEEGYEIRSFKVNTAVTSPPGELDSVWIFYSAILEKEGPDETN